MVEVVIPQFKDRKKKDHLRMLKDIAFVELENTNKTHDYWTTFISDIDRVNNDAVK